MSSSKSRLVSVTYADQKAWGISLQSHTPRSEVVPLDSQCGLGSAAPDDHARHDQLQLDVLIEQDRPGDGDVEFQSGLQWPLGGEAEPRAAYSNSLSR